MSEITLNSDNVTRFNKRLQKALSEYLGQDVKLHEAAKLFAKAIGKDSEYELKKTLDTPHSKNETPLLVNAYIAIDEKWAAKQDCCNNFTLNSDDVDIVALYSEKNYVEMIKEGQLPTASVVVAVQVSFEDLMACANSSLFGDHWSFEIHFLVYQNHFQPYHDSFKQRTQNIKL